MRSLVLLLVLVAAVGGAVATAGCFEEPGSPVEVTPYLERGATTSGQTTPFVLHVRSLDTFKQDLAVRVDGLPAGWIATPSPPHVLIEGRASLVLVVNVTPPEDAPLGPQELAVRVGRTPATMVVDVRAPADARVTEGSAVRLDYVMWTQNGTIAATSVPELRNQTTIPNATTGSAAPLPADVDQPLLGYVGDAPVPPRLADQGYVALPVAWRDALLRDGEGAEVGHVVLTSAHMPGVESFGVLLRVLDVEAPAEPSEA